MSSGGLDKYTEGNPYNQSKTDQRAGILSIVAEDDALISKMDYMAGTGSKHVGNHVGNDSADGLKTKFESTAVKVVQKEEKPVEDEGVRVEVQGSLDNKRG